MSVSGVVSFNDLTAAGIRVLREFEAKRIPGVRFTFGPAPDRAVLRWDSLTDLAVASHIVELVEDFQNNREPAFPPLKVD